MVKKIISWIFMLLVASAIFYGLGLHKTKSGQEIEKAAKNVTNAAFNVAKTTKTMVLGEEKKGFFGTIKSGISNAMSYVGAKLTDEFAKFVFHPATIACAAILTGLWWKNMLPSMPSAGNKGNLTRVLRKPHQG